MKRDCADRCDFSEPAEPRTIRNRSSTARPPIFWPSLDSDDRADPDGAPTQAPSNDIAGSPEVSIRTNLRMLSSARGERVFIGEHASLSFLQLMRDIVRTSIGTSKFSSEPRQDFMLEAELEDDQEIDENLFTDQHSKEYVDGYLLATNGLVDIFDREDIMLMLQTVNSDDNNNGPLFTAVTHLILAIGAQVVADENYAHKEHVLFALGRKAAFRSFLEDPGLMTVQIFLLCAFYMFGACRRNAAYMYLGVAMRAAHTIGLHNHISYSLLSPADAQKRSRIWRSLFTLDVAACSILGRPSASATTKVTLDEDSEKNVHSKSQSDLALNSAYKLAIIVESISSNLHGRKSLHVEDAERQLESVQGWSTKLPDAHRGLSVVDSSPSTESRRGAIGNLHISCFYHFCLLLITRPFLVPVLMKRIATQQPFQPTASEILDPADEARAARLAHTCINVSIYMAQNCWDALAKGIILDNMCILKAWIFSAALVIGFHLFTMNEPDTEAENSFSQAQSVLQHIAKRSPQAKHYFDILVYLHDAIKKRHNQRATPSRKQNAFVIDRLAIHDSFPSSNTHTTNPTSGILGTEDIDFQLHNEGTENWLSSVPINGIDVQQMLQNSDFAWDAAMAPFWNQFSFDI